MNELRNCPFCGIDASPSTNEFGYYLVICTGCLARTAPHESEKTAIAAWNARAYDAELEELRMVKRQIESLIANKKSMYLSALENNSNNQERLFFEIQELEDLLK